QSSAEVSTLSLHDALPIFGNGGKVVSKLAVTGTAPRGRTGTTITFWPDGTIFDETEFRSQTVLERLQVYAFLNKGLEIRFNDERDRKSTRLNSSHRTISYA